MNITTFTFIVLFAYLFILKAVSLIAARAATSSVEDYFLSGRNVGTVAVIATTMASIFSTATVVGSPAEFYVKGTDFYWILAFGCIVFAFIPLAFKFWLIGKKKKFITSGELVGDLYQSKKAQLITAIIGLMALLPYACAQIIAIGKTFEALTAGVIYYELGVVIATVAIGLYLFYGGSRAVILTDVIQGFIFGSLILVAAGLCIYWSGGLTNLLSTAIQKSPEQFVYTPSLKYYEMFLLSISFFFLPHVWQRMYMAKSAKTIAKNITTLPFILAILYTCTFIIGHSAFSIIPEGELSEPDQILGTIFNLKAPYFGAFFLIAAFAAGMSTIDSQLLTSGSIVVRDIMPQKFFSSEKHQYNFARITTMSLLVLCFTFSLLLKNQSTFGLVITALSVTPLLIPTIFGGFFWKLSSETASIVSMTLGLICFFLHQFTSFKLFFPDYVGAITTSFSLCLFSYLLISLFSKKARKANSERYQEIIAIDE